MSSVENDEAELRTGTDIMSNLLEYYANSTLAEKQLIIGSVFTGKFVFEKTNFRTIELNPVVELMLRESQRVTGKKIGRSGENSESSYQVGAAGFEPAAPRSQTRYATGLRHASTCN